MRPGGAGAGIDLAAPAPQRFVAMSLPQPRVELRRIGREGQPLVVIDGFSGQPERLLEAARQAEYQPGGASYPGIRAWCEPSYLDLRRDLMMQVMQRVFGIRRGISCDVSTFSLVTTPPGDLQPLQRIPHYDNADAELIAVMHYLQGPESGGTAFYRHNRTGFETVTPERERAYNIGLAEDERAYGMPDAAYWHGDGDRFAMIEEVEARPDRMILYRGRALHSGVIPAAASLSADPREGRVTINMFLRGR